MMNSPLNSITRMKRLAAIVMVLALLLIPGLAFASYHGSYDLAPFPEPIYPEGPGDLAPAPPPVEPEPPGDLAPVPEVVDPEEPEVAPEEEVEMEEEELEEEIMVDAEEPEVEAEEVVTGVSQINIWSIAFFALLFLFLIWVLFSRRRSDQPSK